MLFNALLIALREIRRNLTRSFLTVIGIVIGVAAVITMVTLGRGATETVKQQISKMGNNLLILRPGQGWGSWGAPHVHHGGRRSHPRPGAGHRLGRALRHFQQRPAGLSGKQAATTTSRAPRPTTSTSRNWDDRSGRFFTEQEVAESAPVCVIGETIRKELFGEGVDPIGSKIRVKTMTLEVIGVTAVKGQGGFGDDLDDNMITPYTTVIRRLSGRQAAARTSTRS